MSEIVLIPPGQSASISPQSSGFAHGFGLFETMRFEAGQLCFWDLHWERLKQSAKYFGLEVPDKNAVIGAVQSLVQSLDTRELILKLSLLKEVGGTRLYIYSRPAMASPPAGQLILDTQFPIHADSPLSGHKTHNYMECIYLLEKARAQGYRDWLRLDTEGFVAETTTSNVFFIKDVEIVTPPAGGSILPGVAREALLGSDQIEICEQKISPGMLRDMRGAFITNAIMGVQAVSGVEGLPDGDPVDFDLNHPLIEKIRSEFDRLKAIHALKLI